MTVYGAFLRKGGAEYLIGVYSTLEKATGAAESHAASLGYDTPVPWQRYRAADDIGMAAPWRYIDGWYTDNAPVWTWRNQFGKRGTGVEVRTLIRRLVVDE